jgi:hypothetical protein
MARRRAAPIDLLVEVGYARHPALVTLATCQVPGQVRTPVSRPQPGQCVYPEVTTAAHRLMTGHRVAHGAHARFGREAVTSSGMFTHAAFAGELG